MSDRGDRLLEIKSRKGEKKSERERETGGQPDFNYFQNILILCVILMLVYLFLLPTPCFIYCTCQKHSCLVSRLQIWERGRAGLTGVN